MPSGTSPLTRMLKEREPSAVPSKTAEGEAELLTVAAMSPEAVLSRLGAAEKGLSTEQVVERLETHGRNLVGKAEKTGFLGEIVERSKNPLVLQLLVIAIVSFLMGDVRAATV